MSARRYSFRVSVALIRTHEDNGYACSVVGPEGDPYRVVVGDPACLTRAVDSPDAYDDAARAAIAFAMDDDRIDDSDVAFDDRQIVVSRKRVSRRVWRESGTVL